MPDPKDNAKATGDTHLPDLDSDQDESAPKAEYQRSGGTPDAGIKDKEAPTSNSYGHTRDSGERPDVKPKE
jgi:hypothetical protein